MTGLARRERPAAGGEPVGLLVLHHGRGTDEQDLLGLADVLDPERRLHVVTPRGPLALPGWPGRHWYSVPQVGHPDPTTFHAAYRALADLHSELRAQTGLRPARTILGGFSMGTVMSYALGLGGDRPAPAGILALSGFVPTVEGWQPSLEDRQSLRAFVAHGRRDPVISVDFARRAVALLRAGGIDVLERESDAGHHVVPADLAAARDWVAELVAGFPATAGANRT